MPRDFCPLDFNSLLCNLPFELCPNYFFCRLQVLAWELPYDYVDGCLTVKPYGTAFGYTNFRGKLFNDSHIIDNNTIAKAWQEVGWFHAVPWPFDSIPF
jgi:hypothetical protein